MTVHYLDARRLLCPMPVIKVQNTIKNLKPGDILEVVCTDPGVINDIPAWCRINHHQILEVKEQPGEIRIAIKIQPNH